MKVDIWSDVRCPFCYIGKRKFELALEKFEHKNQIQVEWHSFELDPQLETKVGVKVSDYVAEMKGLSNERMAQLNDHVAQAGAEVGLRFNFEDTVLANSFHAHRLIQLAKSMGIDNEIEELLFHAYFVEGKNIDDLLVLKELGIAAGIDSITLDAMLNGFDFSNEVRADEQIAQQIGISGVPFFVFDQKLAVSGAQPVETFFGAMEQAWGAKV